MPDRILRDEILDSERWLAVDCGAKLAFVACLLKCDAVGNLDAQPLRLYRLWRDFGAGTVEASEAMLKQLEAVDLVREYVVGKRRFIHIPRFGQRVRYVGSLHPGSPWDREGKQTKQNAAKNSPGDSQAQVGFAPSDSQALTGCAPAEVKRSEVKRSEENLKTATVAIPSDNARASGNGKIAIENKEKPKPNNGMGQQWDVRPWVLATALSVDVKQRPGESWEDFRDRVYAAVQAKLAAAKAKLKSATQASP